MPTGVRKRRDSERGKLWKAYDKRTRRVVGESDTKRKAETFARMRDKHK
jgi:hypothetical protein